MLSAPASPHRARYLSILSIGVIFTFWFDFHQGVYKELIIGGSGKYHLTRKKDIYSALYGGLWWRNKDAACLSFGYDYKDLFVGISYDINFSKLVPASQLRGGIEFAVRYVIRKFNPKRIIHRVCPDYI